MEYITLIQTYLTFTMPRRSLVIYLKRIALITKVSTLNISYKDPILHLLLRINCR